MGRATTARLAIGENTIDRSTPTRRPDGLWRLQWTMALADGRKWRGDNTGATKGEVRRRAKAKAEELRRSGGGDWQTTDSLASYIEQVSKPAVAKTDLTEATRRRYDLAWRWLLGDCDRHRHKHSLSRHTIASGVRFSALEALLTEIAVDHGVETAKQCRTVLTKYVVNRLVHEGLITGNPIAGVRLDELTGVKRWPRTRGGKSITATQVEAVLDHLLALDPAEGYTKRQGRWNAATVAKRRNTIDQLLLQLATGLRSTEANRISWSRHLKIDDSGVMYVNVTKDVAKGGIPRVALVLVPRVAERLLERRNLVGGTGYVIGAPSDPAKFWTARNRNKAAAALYQELAEKLDIEVMISERSHMWRTTLRSLYDGKAPAAVLNSQFGHSEKTAQRHYTDVGDLSGLARAAGLRVVPDPDKIPDNVSTNELPQVTSIA